MYIDEHTNLIKGVKVLAESAERALGGIIGKSKNLKNMGFHTISSLWGSLEDIYSSVGELLTWYGRK